MNPRIISHWGVKLFWMFRKGLGYMVMIFELWIEAINSSGNRDFQAEHKTLRTELGMFEDQKKANWVPPEMQRWARVWEPWGAIIRSHLNEYFILVTVGSHGKFLSRAVMWFDLLFKWSPLLLYPEKRRWCLDSCSSGEDGEMQTGLRSILNAKVRGLTDGLNGSVAGKRGIEVKFLVFDLSN